ncbi:maleylacetate reductase [Actinoplanes philippinensis]|uniref:Alcohol dehydrogenase, class IV n=1 Tax=Actinoplanes philippinensis TaxID=35752 RepID=A0A1I2M8I2_9ACTN|nr:maleylacetate reductase [Actinoplanes philippinensis]GIE83078.1 maleylacetate reductase [Actinoplanes philippinensis]SFF87200.1 Alcohol dehydrogenase, class IV [Actinoplanes philippinensis]
MNLRFTHETLPQRVVFGPAAEHLAAEVARLGERPLVIGRAAADLLPGVPRHREVVMHVPVAVAERARAVTAGIGADVLVSIGGGSATGLAKAVALTTGLPIVAVPTTYAGSEATDVWGLTDDGRKTTGADRRVLPRTVVYDATLTRSLPADLSIASGLNAVAHCVDSLWAPRADPINQALALAGIRALTAGLTGIAARPDDLAGREQTLYGAHLAAVAFASAGSGLHHKICHVLGGMFDLPHAQTHAVVLPYVMALNAHTVRPLLAGAFGPDGLQGLRDRIGAPRALRDYGFRDSDIPAAVAAILPIVPPGNPVAVTGGDLTDLLRHAWAGDPPGDQR